MPKTDDEGTPAAKFGRQPLGWGEPVPSFHVKADCNPRFAFSSTAGRNMVVSFLESSKIEERRRTLELFVQNADRFDGKHAGFAVVLTDQDGEAAAHGGGPAFRFFFDVDRRVSNLFGVISEQGYQPTTYVLDQRLRVLARIPLDCSPEEHVERALAVLAAAPVPSAQSEDAPAPVLVVPRVFDEELCSALIAYYQAHGGRASGFMREVDGRTRLITDPKHKVRSDCIIDDASLRERVSLAINLRLVPEIAKSFQFRATRIERHLVASYRADDGSHFAPHRDNTTAGTAHRRFAVTVNLNTEQYEGGALRFPEFGAKTYRAPTGAALVFSCSLLHEVLPLVRGVRFAYLPFLYDEVAARLRQANAHLVDAGSET